MDRGQIRFWQGVSCTLAAVLGATALRSVSGVVARTAPKQQFAEIDVQRINIVEADGTVKLVIANRERAPDQVSEGQSRPRTPGNKSPGITFFDDAGDEAGGLKIRGDRRAGPSARRHLLFDQHRGDQTLGLIADENAEGRQVGLTVWDRPDMPLPQVVARMQEVAAMPPGPERERAAAEMNDWNSERVFLGKTRSRDSVLRLEDAQGHERLRLVVTAAGQARIEFLDERGRVTSTLPR